MAKEPEGFRRPIPRELEKRAACETDAGLSRVQPMTPEAADAFGGVLNGIGRKN